MSESLIWTPTKGTDSLYRDFLEATTPIRLKPFQQEIFHVLEERKGEGKHQGIVASRQVGKTYGLANFAYSFANIHEESLILIVSTGENHAKEILGRVRDTFNKSIIDYEFSRDSEEEIRLRENGSRIVSRPSNPRTVRGYSPHLLIIDEVAAIEHWEDMQASLFPSVSQTNGMIVLSSTYKGKNHFWRMMMQPEWNCLIYPWQVSPSAQIEEQRRTLPVETFAEEYECRPIDESWSLFPLDLIEASTIDECEEWTF